MLPTSAAILLASLVVLYLTTRAAHAEEQKCEDIPTETRFKPEDVEGTWFPTDMVLHHSIRNLGLPPTSQCPVVTFSFSSKGKPTLNMVWNSTEGELEYKFERYQGKGHWRSITDKQGGKFYILSLEKDKYMILRFCSPTTHNSYFLSRQSGGSQQFVQEARSVLAKLVKYPQVERQTLCSSVAGLSNLLPSTAVISIFMFVLLL